MSTSGSEPSGRSDLARNRGQIVGAAAAMLRTGETLTASSVAARAGLARATIYRHFATMADLTTAAQAARDRPDGTPTAELAALLDRTPAHAVAAEVVAQAKAVAPGAAVALYLVDIDGTRLQLAVGDDSLPREIEVRGIGPEVPEEQLEQLRRAVGDAVADVELAPLLLRRRAVGVLVASGPADPAALAGLAHEAAMALDVAARFTDELQRSRRHRDTTASAEVQQLLLPPRVAQLSGLRFAGQVQPAYESGGNWFDHAENDDGAWIAAVDTIGSNERAAAISAVALGALRAVRNAGSTPTDALQAMHDSIAAIGLPDVACSAWVARWHQPSARLFWAAAGDLRPLRLRPGQVPVPLSGPAGVALGAAAPPRAATNYARLGVGDMVLLLSDGLAGGEASVLSEPDLDRILSAASDDPATLIAALMTEVASSQGPLDDDAMALAFAPLDAG